MRRKFAVTVFAVAALSLSTLAVFAGGRILSIGHMQIPKKEVTATARLYPYKTEARPLLLKWKTR